MLSKNRIKFIKSLQIKKFRKEHGQFLVEGAKSVSELLKSDYNIHTIFLTEEYIKCWEPLLKQRETEVVVVKQQELESAGTFESNNAAIAIAGIKPGSRPNPEKQKITLALDDVRDPGNMGTIIRVADWYGIRNIVCSENSVDFYNPKVIGATMGSFTRTNVYYADLNKYLNSFKGKYPVYGAVLGGENLHRLNNLQPGFLVMGNESNGISEEIRNYVTKQIEIPGAGAAESLNVAIATAVMLDNFTRLLG
jgi:RNA methyltransferase, TrmH family